MANGSPSLSFDAPGRLCHTAQELADASVTDLLRRFRSGLLSVFHALLNKKRVVFLGHSQPAETVCLAVLSSPLLVCPPLEDLLSRCFPYTTLNNLDFLETEGFVAGTTNPIFESHPEWWDVLCDIDSGKTYVSAPGEKGRKVRAASAGRAPARQSLGWLDGAPHTYMTAASSRHALGVSTLAPDGAEQVAVEPPRLSELDEELYEQASTGLDAHYSEYWLRGAFQEHAQQLTSERQRGSAALGAELAKHTRKDAAVAPSAMIVAQYLEQVRATLPSTPAPRASGHSRSSGASDAWAQQFWSCSHSLPRLPWCTLTRAPSHACVVRSRTMAAPLGRTGVRQGDAAYV